MDQAVIDYIDGIPGAYRPLFERIHQLIIDACPEATVVLSYNMPTYKVAKRRLHLAVWEHGVSLYGWKHAGDGGLTEHHPELRTSTGTIRLRPEDAATVTDDEIRQLARTVLGAAS